MLLNYYDSVGIVLMIRIVHAHRMEAEAQGLGMFLSDLYETQLDLLWARLGELPVAGVVSVVLKSSAPLRRL